MSRWTGGMKVKRRPDVVARFCNCLEEEWTEAVDGKCPECSRPVTTKYLYYVPSDMAPSPEGFLMTRREAGKNGHALD